VILSNAGHFNVEIAIPALEEQAHSRRLVKKDGEEFTMHDGRRIYLLADIHLRLLDLVQGFVYTQRKIRRAILLALGTAFRKCNFFLF
jgi:S-adenosylhomocysteine hydrolase